MKTQQNQPRLVEKINEDGTTKKLNVVETLYYDFNNVVFAVSEDFEIDGETRHQVKIFIDGEPLQTNGSIRRFFDSDNKCICFTITTFEEVA